MVHGHQHLLGVQPKLHGNGFEHVNGGPIHIGLAGFTQAAVAHRQAIALEEAGERRWTAVHSRGLYHLGGEQVAPGPWEGSPHEAPSWRPAAASLWAGTR